ncbi:MAG TPA: N-acetylmuramoyl-L-alanine amidase [Acidobacteriota bacterium]
MTTLRRCSFALIFVAVLIAGIWFSQGQTLQFFHDNRQSKISPREHDNVTYYSLRDVSNIFGLPIDERSPEEFLMRGPRGSITFFKDKPEIRVNGEIVALSRPVWRRKGEHWYVTSDFFDKVLPRIIGVQLVRKSATAFELQPAQAQPGAVEVKAQTSVSPDHTRLSLETSQGVTFQSRDAGNAVEVTANRKIRILVPPAPPNQSFMGRISFDPSGNGVLRIEKGQRFQSSREQTLENPQRRVIDFYGPPEVPATAPALPQPPAVQVPVLPPIVVPPDITTPQVETQKFVRRPNRNVIVLDPGHGGSDLGVHPSTELLEKALTLLLAQQVKTLLESQGAYKVVITRQSDAAMPIVQRTAIANSFHAEVFVSLHFGGSYDPGMRGGRVYYYADVAGNSPAGKENLPAETAASPGSGLTPWKTSQLSLVPRSQTLAARLQAKLNDVFGTPDTRVGSRQFLVLQGSLSPAVILEAGYLSNPDEAKFLADTKNLKTIGGAIAGAILDFLGGK